METELRARRLWILALGGICLLALGVRLLGLGFGLPAVYNPDEIPILNRALALAKGDPNPHNFLYPSLYFYAVFAWEAAFFVLGRAAGLFGSLGDFQREYFTDPTRLLLAARAFTAVCGALVVPALYWFGKRLYNRGIGLAAGLFYALAPLAARDAHYVKLDVPVTLMIVLTHAALARIVVDEQAAGTRRAWIVAGLLGGLAISTHYYVGLIVFSFVAVALADLRRSGRWQTSLALLAWSAAAVGVGFLAGTPFMVVEPQTAIRDIVAVREIDIDRAVVTGAFVSVKPYLSILLHDALGWPVCLAAAAGAVWAICSDWRRGLLLVTFPLLFLAFVFNTVPQTRYLNAMLPSLALAAAFALARVAHATAGARRALPPLGEAVSGSRGKWAAAVTAAIVLAAAVPGLAGTFRADLFIRQTDTRTIAREFIEAHVPAASSVLLQPYSVPLRRSRDAFVEALKANLGSVERASIKFQLQLDAGPYDPPTYRVIFLGDGGEDPDKIYISPRAFRGDAGLSPLRPFNIDYVILKRYNVDDPAMRPLATALSRDAQLLATFSPYRRDAAPEAQAAVHPFLHNTALRIDPVLERPGPIIEVWRIRSWN
jgi:hypothetical protein